MPELPEVECLTRAVRRQVKGGRLLKATFFRPDLRGPIPIDEFRSVLEGEVIEDVFRRSKYMLWKTSRGYGVVHLGMTGNMLCRTSEEPRLPHTHAVFQVEKESQSTYLHYVDPRRFGRISCIVGDGYEEHEYFLQLGPEPLKCKALGKHLFKRSRGRIQPVKNFVMDAHVVVGVGNIYANEALWSAGVHPARKAGAISAARYDRLANAIKTTLKGAIKAGGTTFRDFKNADGNPGYFALSLAVYDRAGEPCQRCSKPLRQLRQAGRSTVFCSFCQK